MADQRSVPSLPSELVDAIADQVADAIEERLVERFPAAPGRSDAPGAYTDAAGLARVGPRSPYLFNVEEALDQLPACQSTRRSPSPNVDRTIERIAIRVVELLGADCTAAPELIDAAGVARRFGVSRDFVYEHAAELGAVRLGNGPKARLRFDPEKAERALTGARMYQPEPKPGKQRRRPMVSVGELLPIRTKKAR